MTPSQGRPLAGRRVVVTRPQAQADGLCQAIAAAGGEALCIPATSTVETNIKVTEREMLRRRPLTK